MCTAISQGGYFGRNLDWEHSFGEKIVITPQNYSFRFRHAPTFSRHYAIIGAAIEENDYPLYFDAVNEKGLAAAGLNFPTYCKYMPFCQGVENVASFEIIPYILSQCACVSEAEKLLSRINITEESFSPSLPPSPLHFLIADSKQSIVLEQTSKGRNIWRNETGTLTNSPSFDMQLFYLSNFLNLSPKEGENRFSDKLSLSPCSRGMGAFSLPGDFSSSSRFVKAAFLNLNSPKNFVEGENVAQIFNILGSIMQIKGACLIGGKSEYTVYSSCINLSKGIYYYKTYCGNICSVDINKEDLKGNSLISYPFKENEL